MKRESQSVDQPGPIPPCNRGQRLIVVHPGSHDGFIKGADLVYKATSRTGDYQSEMNKINFNKRLLEKLFPNLKHPSTIVLDNASYNSMQVDKCPNTSSKLILQYDV